MERTIGRAAIRPDQTETSGQAGQHQQVRDAALARVAHFPGADQQIERQVVGPAGEQQPGIPEQRRDTPSATRIRPAFAPFRRDDGDVDRGEQRRYHQPATRGMRRCRGTAASSTQEQQGDQVDDREDLIWRHGQLSADRDRVATSRV